MNRSFFAALAFTIFLGIIAGRAQAACSIAVGGPYVLPLPRAELTQALERMFQADQNYEVKVFETDNLLKAARLGADYLVYLKSAAPYMQVQVRDILLNKVIWEDRYNALGNIDDTVDVIRRDIQQNALPLLGTYCRKAE